MKKSDIQINCFNSIEIQSKFTSSSGYAALLFLSNSINFLSFGGKLTIFVIGLSDFILFKLATIHGFSILQSIIPKTFQFILRYLIVVIQNKSKNFLGVILIPLMVGHVRVPHEIFIQGGHCNFSGPTLDDFQKTFIVYEDVLVIQTFYMQFPTKFFLSQTSINQIFFIDLIGSIVKRMKFVCGINRQ